MKPNLKLIAPTIENRAVRTNTLPRRPKNAELRQREYLTPTEVDQLIAAAKDHRHGHRDGTLILVCYRHGFRASEICDLRWSQIDLDQARLHVRRVKRGTPSVHPLQGDELRALRRLKRESPPHSNFVFVTERGGPFTTTGFAFLISRAGTKAGLPFKAHPHMLRHRRNPRPVRTGGYRRRRTVSLQSCRLQRAHWRLWQRRFCSACLSGGRLGALQASTHVALLFLLSECETFTTVRRHMRRYARLPHAGLPGGTHRRPACLYAARHRRLGRRAPRPANLAGAAPRGRQETAAAQVAHRGGCVTSAASTPAPGRV
jgi:hypothetical protein